MPRPFVSVVVPCRNEAANVEALLEAIERQSVSAREIVIVDDGSSDDTSAIVRRWERTRPWRNVVIVTGPGLGAAAAMNAGIRHASADIIVRLDGHCLPDVDYVARSIETLALPGAGVAGGVWEIAPRAASTTARGIAAVLSHPLGSGGAEYRKSSWSAVLSTKEVDTVPYGAFRTAVWAEVGGFDESLVRNQDYDFNHRVRLTGRRILLNPEIVSVYKARATFGALARQYFDYGCWKVVMLRKFPASIRLRQLLPLLLVPALVLLAVWALATRSWLPLALLVTYPAINLSGATHASLRAGGARLIPAATMALITLQVAWSAGAWGCLLRGARAKRK